MTNPSYVAQRVEHTEFPISTNGYYAMRIHKKGYTKLVRADRSGKPNLAQELAIKSSTGVRQPQIGKRSRIQHRARAPK